jgi:flotillin
MAEAQIREAQGLAVAEGQKAQGLAEALTMEKKAEAWREYNEAAVLQLLAPILPEIARAIAEPLARIDRITMVNTGGNGEVGVSRLTGEMARVMAQVPPVLESLTGLNLNELLARLRPTGAAGDGEAKRVDAEVEPPPTKPRST